jgi:asparagine N-glycosylation enzyme membrane subunit Stt3
LAGKKNKENKSVERGKEKKSSEKKSLKPEHPISQQIGQPTETEQPLIERLKSGAPYGALLAIIFAIALYIRAVLPHDSVFLADGTVRFGGNDPWYHLRIVEYILHNYPHTLTYDAFTEFPYGHFQHYGPLYDHTIAFISIVLGFGNPDMHLVNTVGAYFPAVLGALVVIPVYFIGKHLHNRGTGLLAALIIATLPGQFLSRSLLGFTDHHVAETLFSTATILFFMLALMSARAQNLSLSDLNRNWHAIKYPLIYSIMAGVSYAGHQVSAYLFYHGWCFVRSISTLLDGCDNVWSDHHALSDHYLHCRTHQGQLDRVYHHHRGDHIRTGNAPDPAVDTS